MSLFQSNLRKQIKILPKILNFVKKIHYYSKLFTSLLIHDSRMKVMNADRNRQLSKDETSGLIIVFRAMNVGDVLVTRSFGWLDLLH